MAVFVAISSTILGGPVHSEVDLQFELQPWCLLRLKSAGLHTWDHFDGERGIPRQPWYCIHKIMKLFMGNLMISKDVIVR